MGYQDTVLLEGTKLICSTTRVNPVCLSVNAWRLQYDYLSKIVFNLSPMVYAVAPQAC